LLRVAETTDLRRCEELWRAVMPEELVTDLWEVRACFQRHFDRPARFITVEDGATLVGLLPLSWIEEAGRFGIFPGETWKGRTWLEQNRIFARDQEALSALLAACPENVELRYLLPLPAAAGAAVDEVGYLFSPGRYGYDLEGWFAQFSHKNAKRLRREIAAVEAQGLRYRFDDPADLEALVALNLGRFAGSSYFDDPRFLAGFRDLVDLLAARGWLRMTTILAGAEPVAVDLGCCYRGTCTMLAGGTHAGYPGIAKVINLHHLRRACAERYERVDFLCGEFSWKPLFHLEPRPLYLYGERASGYPPGDTIEAAPPAREATHESHPYGAI
jgi:hypothetical protein